MAKNFFNNISNFFLYKDKSNYDFTLPSVGSLEVSNDDSENLEDVLDPNYIKITSSLDENLDYIKARYNSLINSDIEIREFYIMAMDKRIRAFLIYIDGMANTESINNFILKPLMLRNRTNTYTNKVNDKQSNENSTLEEHISNCLLPQNKVTMVEDFSQVTSDINVGNCVGFVDTLSVAYSVEVKNFKQRSIKRFSRSICRSLKDKYLYS